MPNLFNKLKKLYVFSKFGGRRNSAGEHSGDNGSEISEQGRRKSQEVNKMPYFAANGSELAANCGRTVAFWRSFFGMAQAYLLTVNKWNQNASIR